MNRNCALLIVALLCVPLLRADTLVLVDGREIEGEILSEDATSVTLKASFGKTTIQRDEIKEIRKSKSKSEIFRAEIEALEKSSRKDDTAAWLNLALRAKKDGARAEARQLFQRVLDQDPNSLAAREELGYVRRGDSWVKEERPVATAAAPAAPATNGAAAADAGGGVSREKLAAMIGGNVEHFSGANEQPATCPKCSGSGYAIILDCLNCLKSQKPGFTNHGVNGWQVCDKCRGTTKIIGAVCFVCRGAKKVVLSHLKPSEGGQQKAPAGYNWCTKCSGSGYEIWNDCGQCKRSKWPGWNYSGESVSLCNRCNGAAKLPGLKCTVCNGSGLESAYKK